MSIEKLFDCMFYATRKVQEEREEIEKVMLSIPFSGGQISLDIKQRYTAGSWIESVTRNAMFEGKESITLGKPVYAIDWFMHNMKDIKRKNLPTTYKMACILIAASKLESRDFEEVASSISFLNWTIELDDWDALQDTILELWQSKNKLKVKEIVEYYSLKKWVDVEDLQCKNCEHFVTVSINERSAQWCNKHGITTQPTDNCGEGEEVLCGQIINDITPSHKWANSKSKGNAEADYTGTQSDE